MRVSNSRHRIEDARFLEVTHEHLEQFLKAVNGNHTIDRARIEELIRIQRTPGQPIGKSVYSHCAGAR